MKVRLFNLVVVLALVSTFVLTAFSPVEAKKGGSYTVNGITGITDSGQTFSGTYEITRFAVQNGELVAIGNLTGTLSGVAIPVTQAILPVTDFNSDCEILYLELGPIDLTLLGLNVHLDQVVLDITATPGGGLLGSLLCAVANLFNGNAALNAIAALLNQILGALG